MLPLVDLALSIQEPGYGKALAWFALVFIGPAIFGLLLGLNIYTGITRKILRRLHLNTVHVIPTALAPRA